MNNLRLWLVSFLGMASLSVAKTIEITQKSSGKSLEVEVQGVSGGKVKIKTGAGKVFTLPLSQLTDESVEAIKEAMSEGGAEAEEGSAKSAKSGGSEKAGAEALAVFEKVNGGIGHDLFGEEPSLWKEDAAKVAKRLGWKLESRKEGSSSYRLYTKLDYKFLGAHPYCVTLYGGAGDLPEQFSLVYANKGDFGSRLGMGPDHFKKMHPAEKVPGDLDDAIELDERLIAQKLTEALGEPEKQYYGEKEDKRKVQRWDVSGHAFLLSALDEEYVHLLIVPTATADAEGKVKFVKDSDLKKIQLANVKEEANGDVWIDNIPMVNQGPKGYCAPATFERAMRYMKVPADMYLLATAATGPEGTNTTKLAEDCKRIVRSKARRIKDLKLEKDFKISKLKKFIDDGVPVLWQMRSLKAYNDLANKRSKEREKVKDFKKWADEIADEAEEMAPKLGKDDNHHICMVIGYNEETNEVAVSDSWGPKYEIRWVHESIGQAVTGRGGFVIDF